MMRWMVRILCLALAVASGAQLFILKFRVLEKEEELKEIHRQILADSREIYILEGELALVNNPTWIKRYVDAQGGFKPIEPDQLKTVSELPDIPKEEAPEEKPL